MKILFVDTYYPKVLINFRKSQSDYPRFSYKQYKEKLLNTFFGTSDFYSQGLINIGWKADNVIVNDEILQKKWAKEKALKIRGNWLLSKLQTLPYVYKFLGNPVWIQDIALEQIREYKPDVIYMHNLNVLNVKTLKKIKKVCKLLVGQIASPLPSDRYLKMFDLIITSFPHFVKIFRNMSVTGKYQKLAFEQRALKRIGKQKRIYDITFIGSFTPYHIEGTKALEKLARRVPIHVWGQGVEFLSPLSPLRKNYHGEAWGLDMYEIFAKSKIVINRHIGVSGEYANNMRLYETTGMGAMLITDHKRNLNDLFKVGKEVVEYKNSEDLIYKVNYYLKNGDKRIKIAKAGQNKTLRSHNYNIRMKELVEILNKYLKKV